MLPAGSPGRAARRRGGLSPRPLALRGIAAGRAGAAPDLSPAGIKIPGSEPAAGLVGRDWRRADDRRPCRLLMVALSARPLASSLALRARRTARQKMGKG
jgi:hypothetical protein